MNIYLTLDYELFLGVKTGTPENCLIRPMDELCKVADKHHFKIVIFVDATYLLRMRQLRGQFREVDRQYELVSNHVKSLAEQGHDVELHFHPQWLYSNWDEESQQWKMDRDHYKLSDMPLDDAKRYLREAKDLLDGIVGYKTIAYRAGGFCLDEFKDFKEIFRELGLKIDSSVARYGFVKSRIHYYDYRRVPSKIIYRFEDSIIKENEKGQFKEMSISGFRWGLFKFIVRVRNIRDSYQSKTRYGDGVGIKDHQNRLLRRFIKVINPIASLACIDGGEANLLNLCLDEAVKLHQKDFVIIGHPKYVSLESLEVIENFIVTNSDNLCFKTTSDILQY